jgi:hypothetical protein
MANVYDSGDKIRLSGTWVDSAGLGVEPASVYMMLHPPVAAGVATYFYGGAGASIIRVATGAYYVDFLIASYYPGAWQYRFVSKTSNEAAEEQVFYVNYSAFAL